MANANITATTPAGKFCKDCRLELPLASFSSAGQEGRLRPQCKACTRKRELSRLAARRLADGEKPSFRACSKCAIEKPLDAMNFKPSQGSKHGLTSECCGCLGKRNIEWAKTPKGRAMRLRSDRKNKAKKAEYAQRYQRINRQKITAYVQGWRARNIDRRRKVDREWARANRLKRSAYRHLRRAAGRVSPSDISGLLGKQRFRCVACAKKLGAVWELDHIQPVIKGGLTTTDNLQILCRPCNRSKGAQDPISFMQKRGFLF